MFFIMRSLKKFTFLGSLTYEISVTVGWADWSCGLMQMLKIYANFTDEEINNKIFERYGLKNENKRQITLEGCP